MNFLFNTVVMFGRSAVYYNVYEVNTNEYYAELLNNPDCVENADSFVLMVNDNDATSSIPLTDWQKQWMLQDLIRRDHHNN